MMSNVIPLNAWKGMLDTGEKGVKRNLTNLMLYLRNLPGLGATIRFNLLSMQAEWNGRPISDENFIDIRLAIEAEGFNPVVHDVRPAVMRIAHDNAFNPVTDYLDSLKWDGKWRLDKWLPKLMGAEDSHYTRTVGAKALIGAIARAYQPGCQVDTMLVFEGSQGLRKSSAIKALFGDDFTFEVVSGFDDHKRLTQSLMGAWAVELAEFVSVTRSNSGSVKGLVTIRRDRIMLPYARSLSDLPRRFVFIGTINPGASGYLDDDSGNRRYWPVAVTKCDIEGIVAHRDQIWAEARDRYRANEPWWLEGPEADLAAAIAEERRSRDPWEDVLADKIDRERPTELTPSQVLGLIGVPTDRRDRAAEMRVGKAMRALGWSVKPERDHNGNVRRIWRKASP